MTILEDAKLVVFESTVIDDDEKMIMLDALENCETEDEILETVDDICDIITESYYSNNTFADETTPEEARFKVKQLKEQKKENKKLSKFYGKDSWYAKKKDQENDLIKVDQKRLKAKADRMQEDRDRIEKANKKEDRKAAVDALKKKVNVIGKLKNR